MKLIKKIIFLFIIFFYLDNIAFGLTFEEGYKIAIDKNPEVKIRQNNYDSILHDIEIAEGFKRPSLDLNAKVQKEGHGGETVQTSSKYNYDRNADEYGLTLRQNIYDGGYTEQEELIAKNKYNSARFFLNEQKNIVAIKYTEYYINTLKEQSILQLNTEILKINIDLLNKINKKVSKGLGTKLELERAITKYQEANLNLLIQKTNLSQSIISLQNYLGFDFDISVLEIPVFEYVLPNRFEDILKVSLEQNPSLFVTKENIKVVSGEYLKGKNKFYPNLDFVSSYKINDKAVQTEENTTNDYTVGFELKMNLYNGGKDVASDAKALKKIFEKEYELDNTTNEINNKLKLSWYSMKNNSEKSDNLKRLVKLKEAILNSTVKEFDLGLADLVAILDAQEKYFETKKQQISTEYDLLFDQFRILDGMGIISTEILSGNFIKRSSSLDIESIENTVKNFIDKKIETENFNEIIFKTLEIKDTTYDKSKKNLINNINVISEKRNIPSEENFQTEKTNNAKIDLLKKESNIIFNKLIAPSNLWQKN